jgi:Uma2 family endonuclease
MNFRVPDIAINCLPDERGRRALPAPVLTVEILSPSNERETRENLWAYATISLLREILMVRSTEIAAELLRRHEDGDWPEQARLLAGNDALELARVRFASPLPAFYEDTHLRPEAPEA